MPRPSTKPQTLKQRFAINFARVGTWITRHAAKAIITCAVTAFFAGGITLRPIVDWFSGTVSVEQKSADAPQKKNGNQEGPQNYLAAKPPVEPIVVSDRSGDPVKMGSWVPPEDRLNDARLNGHWSQGGPYQYYWSPDTSHRVEIRVPGGGKWISRFDNEWEYIGTDKPPSN